MPVIQQHSYFILILTAKFYDILSISFVSNIENGNLKRQTLKSLAKIDFSVESIE